MNKLQKNGPYHFPAVCILSVWAVFIYAYIATKENVNIQNSHQNDWFE